jgi:hypothetical protein
MSRIRTIKPEFFAHEELFDAEQSTGLPLRLAFAGLWTQCDRDGRFNWRHRQLKVAIMPHDTVDFSRVLDALAARGFVVKYTSGTSEYGFIPSWTRHQVINNRERASVLPAPTENIEVFDASMTREQREDDAGQGEGKGREGKGKERERKGKERKGFFVRNEFGRAAEKVGFRKIPTSIRSLLAGLPSKPEHVEVEGTDRVEEAARGTARSLCRPPCQRTRPSSPQSQIIQRCTQRRSSPNEGPKVFRPI